MSTPRNRIEKLEKAASQQEPETILVRDQEPGDTPTQPAGTLEEQAARLQELHRLKNPPILVWDLPAEPPAETLPEET